jgi:hypothetical protein
MRFYKHSDGKTYLWPEVVPTGWEFMIKADFSGQVWRKV